MRQTGPVTLLDAVIKAKEIFHKNADTLIAGFLVRHPDVDPADVELVFTPGTDGTIKFTIDMKELHVPAVADDEVEPFMGGDMNKAYREGWNAARDWVIQQAKTIRAPEAMVSTLDAAT